MLSLFMTPCRVTVQAGCTGILIPNLFRMFIIHIDPVMLMTINTGKN